MTKKQQMRWNRVTVQPFLDVRTAVLNGALKDAFRRRHPDFRPANMTAGRQQRQRDHRPQYCIVSQSKGGAHRRSSVLR